MHVDWVTVTAQVVNFLILVYILKRFLYRPVQTAMERRRRQVAERLEEAAQRERMAEEARVNHERQMSDFEDSKATLLLEARDMVDDERKVWLDEARREVEAARRDWHQALERERTDTHDRLRAAVAECALEAARHLLEHLADADLERQMVDRFLERLAELDADQLRELRRAAGPVRVRSAFALEQGERERITQAVHHHLNNTIDVEYAAAPGLLGGVELSAGGLRIGWTLADHLDGLELRLNAAMRSNVTRGESVDEPISPDIEIPGAEARELAGG